MTECTRVLVIDDSEDDRVSYRRALQRAEQARYEMSEASDGDSGLALMDAAEPDCVLLDYSLPGRNGVEVLKRVRAKHPFAPVVMLTGQGNEKVAVAAMQNGAQNYIAKSSITPEELHRAIELAVAHCAMEKRIHDQRMSLEIFTRALAHDLKEPVRTIKSFLSVLVSRENLSADGRRYFDYVHDAADRMAALIDAVYYYTRLDGSAQQMPKEECDAGALLSEAKLDLTELIRERSAEIVAAPLPHITATPSQLRQVFQNLVSNAIRHCDSDPVIHVSATEHPDHWRFTIADNGPGVPDHVRDKIFEPFTRFAHHKTHGLGMGLAICKRIIEAHGGVIWCEQGADGGAVFNFTVPRGESIAAPPTAPATNERPSDPADTKPAGEEAPIAKVLVVDDNEAAIELTKIVLIDAAKLRCKLLSANGGEAALALLHEHVEQGKQIDLVLLDINMPRMDGFELLSRMRQEEKLREVPVVMCTTSGYDQDMERAKSLGAVGYMTKPAELNKLKPMLEQIPMLKLSPRDGGCVLLRVA